MTNSHDNLLKIMIMWSLKMLVLIIVRNVDVMQRCPNMPCYLIYEYACKQHVHVSVLDWPFMN